MIQNPELAKQIAKRRWLRRLEIFAIPPSAPVHVKEREFWVDLGDWRGPSYHVLNWGLESYEKTNIEFLRSYLAGRPNPWFLDIGANIGIFSFVLDREVANLNTMAFEPDDVTFRCLQKTFFNRSRVQIFNLALSSHEGKSMLYSDESNHGGHSLNEQAILAEGDAVSGQRLVDITTLDRFVSDKGARVDAIKLDVQRHEGEVLAGASGTIEKFRPLFLMECYFEDLLARDSSLLKPFLGRDYEIVLPEDRSHFPLDSFDFSRLQRGDCPYRDLAFVPKEKLKA